jgi:hypothetical protein
MLISKREAIYRRDDRTCVYCRRHEDVLEPDNQLTLDHLVPRSHGGGNAAGNLLTACERCNRRRSNQPISVFVGPERAMELIEQAKKPVDMMGGMKRIKPGTLAPGQTKPRPANVLPRYPVSRDNKLHDLVRDLVNTLAYVQPVPAAKMKERAKALGVKFFGETPGEYAGLQEAIDAGRIGKPPT